MGYGERASQQGNRELGQWRRPTEEVPQGHYLNCYGSGPAGEKAFGISQFETLFTI